MQEPAPTTDRLLTVAEAAAILRVGRTRAYEMAASGSLPGVIRVGTSIRVSARRLNEWIEARAVSGL